MRLTCHKQYLDSPSALRARRHDKLWDPAMLQFLQPFADDLPLGDVRAAAREMDARLHADMLKGDPLGHSIALRRSSKIKVPIPRGRQVR